MRVLIFFLLQAYAFALAGMQMPGGVRTDEAKYLLDIPYPHPPVMRWFFNALAYSPDHEFLIRAFIATLLVQSVWFLFPCAEKCKIGSGLMVSLLWLFSSALIVQGGTVMMSVLNAWQGLVLACCALHAPFGMPSASFASSRRPPFDFAHGLRQACAGRCESNAFAGVVYSLVGLFWLFSLMTGYQAFLYLPLVVWIYHKSPLPLVQQILYVALPVLLLFLYSFANPLALVRMIGTAEKDIGLTVFERLSGFGRLWIVAGGGFLSFFGTWGILRSKRWDLIGAFVLASVYIILSRSDYYALLLTPLLVAGCPFVPFLRAHSRVLLSAGIPVMLFYAYAHLPPLQQNDAREVGRLLCSGGGYGCGENYGLPFSRKPSLPRALLVGPFGHEWQYYLPFEIVKYSELLEDRSQEFVLCLAECPGELKTERELVLERPVEVWKKIR